MSELILYNAGDLEVIMNRESLQVFTTQKGYIKLSGRSPQTIARRCDKHDLRSCFPGSVIDAVSGEAIFCRYINLVPDHLILRWLAKDDLEKALMLGAIGVSNYLYQVAGFQVKITLTKTEISKQLG